MKGLTAESVMTRPAICTRENTSAKDVVLVLLNGHFTGVPVTDSENNVIGVITEFDLLKGLQSGKDLAKTAVGDLMTRGAVTADASTSLSEIVDIMTRKNILRLPITQQGKLVGIIARPDILKSQLTPSIFVL